MLSSLPHTMLSSLPQTMLSGSRLPHTMLSSLRLPQTMLSPVLPQTMLSPSDMPIIRSPQTMFCDQAYDWEPITEKVGRLARSHHSPFEVDVSIALASAIAPAALISPAPCAR